MSSRLIKNLLAMLEAEEAAEGSKSSNNGTSHAFNNHGNGEQNFSGAKINSGANSGDRNRHRTNNNYHGRTINNSGTVNGHGNGGFVDGNFDASTKNYKY
ncbi:uncharacterized protein [Cicer arietinum]|uniref:Insoluble matrix shell protein 4-like n=1 Tax=Cicer arietinum TaxID=3827 RepID=A0A1S2XG17_CICAR|nr:insoluble matrix shell protein 4-like [Cicer arietinum]